MFSGVVVVKIIVLALTVSGHNAWGHEGVSSLEAKTPCVTDLDCDDRRACTRDVCDAGTGACAHVPLDCLELRCDPDTLPAVARHTVVVAPYPTTLESESLRALVVAVVDSIGNATGRAAGEDLDPSSERVSIALFRGDAREGEGDGATQSRAAFVVGPTGSRAAIADALADLRPRQEGARRGDSLAAVLRAVRDVFSSGSSDPRASEMLQVVAYPVYPGRPRAPRDDAVPYDAISELETAAVEIAERVDRSARVGLSLFVDTDDPESVATYGDPSISSVYPNKAGYSLGGTLHALIGSGDTQASSMLARLLSRGVVARLLPLRVAAERWAAAVAVLPTSMVSAGHDTSLLASAHGGVAARAGSSPRRGSFTCDRCVRVRCVDDDDAAAAPEGGAAAGCAVAPPPDCDAAAGEVCSATHGCHRPALVDDLFPAADPRLDEMMAGSSVNISPDGRVTGMRVDSSGSMEDPPTPHVHDGTGGILALAVDANKFPTSPRSRFPFLPTGANPGGAGVGGAGVGGAGVGGAGGGGAAVERERHRWADPRSVVRERVKVIEWSPDRNFTLEFATAREPVILRNTVAAARWGAMNWTLPLLRDLLGDTVLEGVKFSDAERPVFFDPDERSPLSGFPTLDRTLEYGIENMTGAEFIDAMRGPESPGARGAPRRKHYYFGEVPEPLRAAVEPSEQLYVSDKDRRLGKQFIWMSSEGVNTHTHGDQDFNFFVQLVGRKRFTLFPPQEHVRLGMFPRTHPMWHKARAHFFDPELSRAVPGYPGARALVADLGPGDVLHVPPLFYHFVETDAPSVSVSTWSHDFYLYGIMRSIYNHDHIGDRTRDRRGRVYALRLFIDILLYRLHGYRRTTHFIDTMLRTRFAGIEEMFPPGPEDATMCESSSRPGEVPTSQNVYGEAKLDVEIVAAQFEQLRPVIRDILVMDYIEEIVAEVVGAERQYAFLRFCFRGQKYYVTERGTREHEQLWS